MNMCRGCVSTAQVCVGHVCECAQSMSRSSHAAQVCTHTGVPSPDTPGCLSVLCLAHRTVVGPGDP